MSNDLGVCLEGIERAYQNGHGRVPVLKGVSLCIEPGEHVLITGENGCGKSTLLRIIGCLDEEFEGSYTFMGQALHGSSRGLRRQLNRLRRRRVGFLHQRIRLMPHLSLLDNMKLALAFGPTPHGERRERALEVLGKVDMKQYADRRPCQLSGGQQQLAGMARALVTLPDLLLVDEPTSSLDPKHSALILNLLDLTLAEHKHRMRCVTVSHRLRAVGDRHYRRLQLEDGRLVE